MSPLEKKKSPNTPPWQAQPYPQSYPLHNIIYPLHYFEMCRNSVKGIAQLLSDQATRPML